MESLPEALSAGNKISSSASQKARDRKIPTPPECMIGNTWTEFLYTAHPSEVSNTTAGPYKKMMYP